MKYLILGLLITLNSYAFEIGEKIPEFRLLSDQGKIIDTNSFKGKNIVLEWLNHGCPFVRKHYDSGNMQKTQSFAKKNKFIWLSIVSSAPGEQGHVDHKGAAKEKISNKSKADYILLDPAGKIGKMFEAKTTPHMFIINSRGLLTYKGAIDSIASSDKKDIKKAKNYIIDAISEMVNNKAVTLNKTKQYGCSVKYAK